MARTSSRLQDLRLKEERAAKNLVTRAKIHQSIHSEEQFPTIIFKEPKRNGERYVIEILAPIRYNGAYTVPHVYGGSNNKQFVYLETISTTMKNYPAAFDHFQLYKKRHTDGDSFIEWVDSLKCDLRKFADAKIGDLVYLRPEYRSDVQNECPYMRITKLRKNIGFEWEKYDANLYSADHLSNQWISSHSISDIANEKVIIDTNPYLDETTRFCGGKLCRRQFEIVAELEPNAPIRSIGFAMKYHLLHRDFVEMSNKSEARGTIVWRMCDAIFDNLRRKYRGKLVTSNVGAGLKSIDISPISEDVFYGCVQKRLHDILPLDWIRENSSEELKFGQQVSPLENHWGIDMYRKFDKEGGFFYGDYVTFQWTYQRSNNNGRLRMTMRVCYKDAFDIRHGGQ